MADQILPSSPAAASPVVKAAPPTAPADIPGYLPATGANTVKNGATYDSQGRLLIASKDGLPVTMLDTGNAVDQVTKDKNYLDTNHPVVAPTGAEKPSDAKDAPAPTTGSGKAYFANQNGQEAEYTQEQLNDPTTQKFLKDNGYVLARADGVQVNGDFSTPGQASGYDQAAQDVTDLAKTFAGYNVNTDPAFQSMASDIHNNFAQLQQAMKQTNNERAAGLATLGLRGGTTQYANGIQMGVEGAELTQAGQRLADLTTRESQAVSAARIAYQNGKFSEFNSKITALKDIRDEKGKTLTDYNNAIKSVLKTVQDRAAKNTMTSDSLIKLAQNGVTLSDDQLKKYDDVLGGAGMAKAIYSGAQQKQKNADDIKFAQDLGKLPHGATVTRDGNTYTSTQVGKLTRVTEKAKDGTTTTVFYNDDGTVHNSSSITPGGTPPPGGTFVLKPAVSEMTTAIAKQLQAENNSDFLSKEDWTTLLKQWEAKGGNRKDFIANFSHYANPGAGYDYVGLAKKK